MALRAGGSGTRAHAALPRLAPGASAPGPRRHPRACRGARGSAAGAGPEAAVDPLGPPLARAAPEALPGGVLRQDRRARRLQDAAQPAPVPVGRQRGGGAPAGAPLPCRPSHPSPPARAPACPAEAPCRPSSAASAAHANPGARRAGVGAYSWAAVKPPRSPSSHPGRGTEPRATCWAASLLRTNDRGFRDTGPFPCE